MYAACDIMTATVNDKKSLASQYQISLWGLTSAVAMLLLLIPKKIKVNTIGFAGKIYSFRSFAIKALNSWYSFWSS